MLASKNMFFLVSPSPPPVHNLFALSLLSVYHIMAIYILWYIPLPPLLPYQGGKNGPCLNECIFVIVNASVYLFQLVLQQDFIEYLAVLYGTCTVVTGGYFVAGVLGLV